MVQGGEEGRWTIWSQMNEIIRAYVKPLLRTYFVLPVRIVYHYNITA
jgi:hypothetical protein